MALKELIKKVFSKKEAQTYTPQREAIDRQHDSLQRELSALQKKKEIPEMKKRIKEMSKEVYGSAFDRNPMGDKNKILKQDRIKRREERIKQVKKISKVLNKPARFQKYTTENIKYVNRQPQPQRANILNSSRNFSPMNPNQNTILGENNSILKAPNTILKVRRRF